jgi:hypothetical protein
MKLVDADGETHSQEEDNDPRIILGFIQQAWSDIRTYISSIWQVAGISLGLVVLTINIAVTSFDTIIPNWSLPLVLLLTSVFLFLGLYTFYWMRENINNRMMRIKDLTEKLTEIKGIRLVPQQNMMGKSYTPLDFIFHTFIILLCISVIFTGIYSFEPISQLLLPYVPSLAFIIAFSISGVGYLTVIWLVIDYYRKRKLIDLGN